jgi:hypothetical protein
MRGVVRVEGRNTCGSSLWLLEIVAREEDALQRLERSSGELF